MRHLIATGLMLLLACSTIDTGPRFTGVDPKVKAIVDDYLIISMQKHLVFTKKVTVGFKHINNGAVVGVCQHGIDWKGHTWREIGIDIDYWNETNAAERIALLYHELTHCYCDRNHDWAAGRFYPSTEKLRIEEAKVWIKNGGPRPGRLEDGCPSSLMYPMVVSADCLSAHYGDYINEMFERCDPI